MTKKRTRRRAIAKKPAVWQQWRHFAAYIYLIICVFDFIAMPIVYEVFHRALGPVELISAARGLEPAAQVEIIKTFSKDGRWEPLTLGETGLFHIAFGAILGVAAWTRGSEKINRIQRGMPEAYDFEDVEDDDHFSDPNVTTSSAHHVGAGEETMDTLEDELPPPGGKMP